MDEKTEELRDIFMDVAEEGTVTETQSEERGSLAEGDETSIDERLLAVIERMRERYEFETALPDEDRCELIRGFYEGADDEALAERLDTDVETVFHARLDLHLLRDEDADAPFDLERLRELRGQDPDRSDIAAELDTDVATVERYERVLDTREATRTVSDRFTSEFEDVLVDAGLSIRLTESVQEDGLEEATEDMEVDVSF